MEIFDGVNLKMLCRMDLPGFVSAGFHGKWDAKLWFMDLLFIILSYELVQASKYEFKKGGTTLTWRHINKKNVSKPQSTFTFTKSPHPLFSDQCRIQMTENSEASSSSSINRLKSKFPDAIKNTIKHYSRSDEVEPQPKIHKMAKSISLTTFICQICESEYPRIERSRLGKCSHRFC